MIHHNGMVLGNKVTLNGLTGLSFTIIGRRQFFWREDPNENANGKGDFDGSTEN